MAKYRIKTKQFCSLSKEQKWQGWLQSVCPELHDDLMRHLQVSRGCRSNHAKMMDIQVGLEKRKLLPEMVKFLRKHYPMVVEEVDGPGKAKPVPRPTSYLNKDNEQQVFKYYNPYLLTFPQKMILENDNPEVLLRQTKEFCSDKVNCDYIIIGNKSFIEYFKRKYVKESKMVPQDSREIHQYRVRNGLGRSDKVGL